MSTFALNAAGGSISDLTAPRSQSNFGDDVVEIGLLLPANWAVALVELSKKREESVGQLIRTCIGRELCKNNAVV